jgi:hypothetical protein
MLLRAWWMLTLYLEIINQTPKPLSLLSCETNGVLVNQTFLIEPFNRNLFESRSHVWTNQGKCYYFWFNDTNVEIMWYFNQRTKQEYYGIVASPDYHATVRVPESGHAQFIIIS